jgi:predicted RNA-binding protein YlxR (DUF448 family)
LLRVVAEPASAETADRPPGGLGSDVVSVVPDPRRRAFGRGAWVHPDLGCVELAQRRRAFGRALRVTAAIDPAAVREYVEQLAQQAQLK